ncbi:MAG: Uma2 family endonuclease [Acidobacteriota bacterium]
MPVATADYLAAIAHLPAGASLRVDDVPWEEYEQLLADLGEGYAVRIFYDQGRMEIMAPALPHERAKNVMHDLVVALRDEMDIEVISLGSTTLRREMSDKGAEPDDCFYVQNAEYILGLEDLNLESDPPPDIVVESDRTSSSLDKFPIYAALGVPEIWRLSKGRVQIHLLVGGGYEQSSASRAFPFLTADALSRFLAQGLAEGERKATRAFRAWLKELHPNS